MTTRTQLLAAAIVRMAHRLGLNLIAKGVETEEQLEHLRLLQCTEVQGMLFSSPLRAGSIPETYER